MVPPFLIYSNGKSHILASPSPTFAGSVAASLAAIRKAGGTQLACLLGDEELAGLGLRRLGEACSSAGLALHRYPIDDRKTPCSAEGFAKFVSVRTDEYRSGATICVHCKAGIGRTGMVIAGMLGQLGMELREAYALITEKRGCLVPDTPGQFEWMSENWNTITGR